MFFLLRTSQNTALLELSTRQMVLPEISFQYFALLDAELCQRQVVGKPDLNCTKSPLRH